MTMTGLGTGPVRPGAHQGFAWEGSVSFAHYLVAHLVSVATAIVSLLLALRALRTRRSAQSVIAWLLGLVFLPWIAAPLYLIFGRRKLPERAKEKAQPFAPEAAAQAPEPPRGAVQRVLFTMGLPRARPLRARSPVARGAISGVSAGRRV